MTKPKPKHQGEPIRIMSGEHGTVVVSDGDFYPDWFQAVKVEAEAADNEE